MASILGKGSPAVLHLQKTRGWSEQECREHVKQAFALWEKRNRVEWHLDLSLITDNGIRLRKNIDARDRYNVANTKLKR